LDIKRIPVRLERNAPSSVRVIRDSIKAFEDVAAIRWNWSTGKYRAPILVELLHDEIQRDLEHVARPPSPRPPADRPG
jgi:hypothetical protein